MSEPFVRFRRFLRELKRRKVYRVAVTYAVVAAGAVQLVSVVIPASRLPAWSDEFFLALAVFGFPIAVVLAWAFEVTPEGVRRTEAVDGEEAAAAGYQWIGLALVVAFAGGIWYATAGDGEQSPSETTAADMDTARAGNLATADSTAPRLGDRSIAVLPFDNLSGTEEAEPFVNGVHDDLLTRLAHVSGLKVISRAAVQQYRDTHLSTGEVANSLGVRWVLEGGVQEMGEQIQVNAQLIDPRTETHAWADRYRRDLTAANLFDLQSEITKRIVRSLEAELTPQETERVERRPTGDLEAYKLYVRGRRRLDTRTEEGMRDAVDYFQRAIAQDSSYALAWSGLADAAGLYPIYGPDPVPASLPDQKWAARRALELAPDLAEAHASMGYAYFKERRGPAALRELKRAVELKPSYAQAHAWLGLLQTDLGRLDDARDHLSLGVNLNPQDGAARGVWVFILTAGGEAEKAQPHLQRVPLARRASHRAFVLYHLKRWDELERLVRQERGAEMDFPNLRLWRFYLARIAVLRGDTAAAREQLAALRQAGRHLQTGLVHATLGETDEAFAAWQRIEEWEEPPTLTLRYLYPDVLSPLRDDPRYRELIGEINQQWGLNPDGSIPDSVDVSFDASADE